MRRQLGYWPIYLDGPVCVRELKPGVAREGHKLTDHVDYNEAEEVMDGGTQWVAPGKGATVAELLVARTALPDSVGLNHVTSLALTGAPITDKDRNRIETVLERLARDGEDRGF